MGGIYAVTVVVQNERSWADFALAAATTFAALAALGLAWSDHRRQNEADDRAEIARQLRDLDETRRRLLARGDEESFAAAFNALAFHSRLLHPDEMTEFRKAWKVPQLELNRTLIRRINEREKALNAPVKRRFWTGRLKDSPAELRLQAPPAPGALGNHPDA